jgi:hypothetical protein
LPDGGGLDYERRPGESARAFAAFTAYRDLPAGDRSVTKAAKTIGKSAKMLYGWSAQHHWADRAEAWDADQDKVGRQARLDAIKEANERHVRTAQAMLREVEAAIPLSAAALCKSPNAVAVWAQAAIKIERDALGMEEPGRPTTSADEPESHGGVDTEVRDVMPFLSDLQRMHLHDIALASVRIRCEQRARATRNMPVDVLAVPDPVTDASDRSAGDDDITDAEVVPRMTLRPSCRERSVARPLAVVRVVAKTRPAGAWLAATESPATRRWRRAGS